MDDASVGDFNILAENYNRYVNYIGQRLINNVELEIGGQKIDKQYSHWMYIWNELSLPVGKQEGYERMVGADSDLTSFANSKLYVPLEFWFCRNIGLALPLIALQYHEVKINIEVESFKNCTYNGTAYVRIADVATSKKIKNCSLWADYIFLDTDERRRFAQMSHEYLIEQVQFTGVDSISTANSEHHSTVSFNHPLKELIVTVNNDSLPQHQWYNYTDSHEFEGKGDEVANVGGDVNVNLRKTLFGIQPDGENPINHMKIMLNGNDRFAQREGTYFSMVQPYQHHTNIPNNQGINVYSFALKPEEHQPSGTLNASRIDTFKLSLSSKIAGSLRVWGVNYNVLRILSGMGGLAYSN